MVIAIHYLRFEVARLCAGQEEVLPRCRQRQLRRRARTVNGIVLRGDAADAGRQHRQPNK